MRLTLPRLAACIGLAAGLASVALAAGHARAADRPALPPCAFEDETNCYWDARARGNGLGASFVSIDGQAFNLADPAMLRLVLLVNRPDGGQAEHALADMPAAACQAAAHEIWRANGAAPVVGFDEYGAIPAFDAVCLPP